MSTTNFTLRRNPSAWLLAVQLLGFLLYPLMETSPSGRALFGAFGLVVLGAALWVVRRSPWLTWLGLLLALPVVVLSVIVVVSPGPQLLVWTAALESLFYFYAAGSLIAYMLQDWVATTDELFAAGATFTLLAWAFGYAYVVCEAVFPGSFVAAGSAAAARTWMELLYLSVAVLSSVGLSDIVPVTPMARAIVMLESVTGVMYIAFVVSSLISMNDRIATERVRKNERLDDCLSAAPAPTSASAPPAASTRNKDAAPASRDCGTRSSAARRDEAADMRPERDAAALRADRDRPAHELDEEPVAQHEIRRHGERRRVEPEKHEQVHVHARVHRRHTRPSRRRWRRRRRPSG